jgi:hypothetical protein
MLKFSRKPFNYANVTATLALFFAMSGGALAAHHYLIHSTKQISPKVLRALRGHNGRTGAPGKTGATGKEGPAGKEGAPGKEGPPGKEGVSGMLRWRTSVQTAGKSEAEAAVVELAKAGPFTVTGHCYESAGETLAATYIRTSEDGSYAQGYSSNNYVPLNAKDGDKQISEETAEGETSTHEASYFGPDDGSWSATSADGSLSLDGFGTQGVWLRGESGPACSFSGFLVTE